MPVTLTCACGCGTTFTRPPSLVGSRQHFLNRAHYRAYHARRPGEVPPPPAPPAAQGHRRLTWPHVHLIRRLEQEGYTYRAIAEYMGCTVGTVSDVARYRTWNSLCPQEGEGETL